MAGKPNKKAGEKSFKLPGKIMVDKNGISHYNGGATKTKKVEGLKSQIQSIS
jgi:hypothetical protein